MSKEVTIETIKKTKSESIVESIPVICAKCGSTANLDPKSLICPACQAKESRPSMNPEQHPTHKISISWPPGITVAVEGLSPEEVWNLYQRVLGSFPTKGQEIKRALDPFIK